MPLNIVYIPRYNSMRIEYNTKHTHIIYKINNSLEFKAKKTKKNTAKATTHDVTTPT